MARRDCTVPMVKTSVFTNSGNDFLKTKYSKQLSVANANVEYICVLVIYSLILLSKPFDLRYLQLSTVLHVGLYGTVSCRTRRHWTFLRLDIK